MAGFLRHVGKHGDRKVAIVFREVPGEPHMALVVYTETLNRGIHDPLIKCIESDIGQSSEDLALALNRTYTTEGQIILQKLHAEGMLKKVNTEQILVTPNPNTRIKLNELNQILDEMQKGEEAVRKLAEMDKQMGMQDPVAVAKRLRGDKDAMVSEPAPLPAAGPNAVLGDTDLANNLRMQAERMNREAQGLMAEAERLLEQAKSLGGNVDTVTESVAPAKKPRGRVKKSVATA